MHLLIREFMEGNKALIILFNAIQILPQCLHINFCGRLSHDARQCWREWIYFFALAS